MLFVMNSKRLIIHIRNHSFRSCQGFSPIKMTSNYVIASDWKCKITKENILCTAVRIIENETHKMKVRIFPNGHTEVFVTYPLGNGRNKSNHFTRDFDIVDLSNITIALDTNANFSTRKVEILS